MSHTETVIAGAARWYDCCENCGGLFIGPTTLGPLCGVCADAEAADEAAAQAELCAGTVCPHCGGDADPTGYDIGPEDIQYRCGSCRTTFTERIETEPVSENESPIAAPTEIGSALARLGRRWVILLPGSTPANPVLWGPAGPVRTADPASEWSPADPALFHVEDTARAKLAQLRGEAADLGVTGWHAMVCRLSDVDQYTVTMSEQAAPEVDKLNQTYPPATVHREQEYALLLPAGPYNEFDPDRPREPFTIYPDQLSAEDRAGTIAEHWAPGLGVADHPVVVVTRTLTTSAGLWRIAETDT